MILDVERQQVVAQQPVEDVVLPRAHAERFAIGPRDVPEVHDDEIRSRVAEQPRQEGEMIVLHEDDGRSALYFFQNGLGKLPVDRTILRPVVGIKSSSRFATTTSFAPPSRLRATSSSRSRVQGMSRLPAPGKCPS